jgi:hypothetical protein
MRILIGLVIGLFIAWNVKQPAIMQELQQWGLYRFDEYVDRLCKMYKRPGETEQQ